MAQHGHRVVDEGAHGAAVALARLEDEVDRQRRRLEILQQGNERALRVTGAGDRPSLRAAAASKPASTTATKIDMASTAVHCFWSCNQALQRILIIPP